MLATLETTPVEVDLEVIEEYLKEHSLDVQHTHTPPTPPATPAQLTHTHSNQHHETSIIENSWSGQYAYEWHYDSNTPNKEYEEQAPPTEWPSPHGNHWEHSTYSYETTPCSESDSTSSICLDYPPSSPTCPLPCPPADRRNRKTSDILPFTSLSGKRKERLFPLPV
ncbi:unnamed protein product [Coregonus sp. 'balchen']|nr:unnamed protein product [Coregonus sp. 'balchen']